ncbi:MAG: phage holin family protein [Patescibacteria group bacterium]
MNLKHLFLSFLAILVAAYILPGVEITIIAAVAAAIVLGIINISIKPLIFILTLPINIFTLGLFSLVINALMILLAAAIVPEFSVAGFWSALFFSILVSLINTLFVDEKRKV